jgi:hypothetical protein
MNKLENCEDVNIPVLVTPLIRVFHLLVFRQVFPWRQIFQWIVGTFIVVFCHPGFSSLPD